jgi:hypothetical protein
MKKMTHNRPIMTANDESDTLVQLWPSIIVSQAWSIMSVNDESDTKLANYGCHWWKWHKTGRLWLPMNNESDKTSLSMMKVTQTGKLWLPMLKVSQDWLIMMANDESVTRLANYGCHWWKWHKTGQLWLSLMKVTQDWQIMAVTDESDTRLVNYDCHWWKWHKTGQLWLSLMEVAQDWPIMTVTDGSDTRLANYDCGTDESDTRLAMANFDCHWWKWHKTGQLWLSLMKVTLDWPIMTANDESDKRLANYAVMTVTDD